MKISSLGLRSRHVGPIAADPSGMDITDNTRTMTLADLLRELGVADDDALPQFWD